MISNHPRGKSQHVQRKRYIRLPMTWNQISRNSKGTRTQRLRFTWTWWHLVTAFALLFICFCWISSRSGTTLYNPLPSPNDSSFQSTSFPVVMWHGILAFALTARRSTTSISTQLILYRYGRLLLRNMVHRCLAKADTGSAARYAQHFIMQTALYMLKFHYQEGYNTEDCLQYMLYVMFPACRYICT